MTATTTGNLLLNIFLWTTVLCAAVAMVLAILALTGLFGIGIQISSDPVIHREVSKGSLALIILLAILAITTSVLILRRINPG